ncbi:MAG: hypothetical protein IKZ21_04470, partial [Clostridia bacterium]|nr:hypothetical protein [Clostridia bacterium]
MEYLLCLLVGFPMLSAILSYLVGRQNKKARDFMVVVSTLATLAFALSLYLGGEGQIRVDFLV